MNKKLLSSEKATKAMSPSMQQSPIVKMMEEAEHQELRNIALVNLGTEILKEIIGELDHDD